MTCFVVCLFNFLRTQKYKKISIAKPQNKKDAKNLFYASFKNYMINNQPTVTSGLIFFTRPFNTSPGPSSKNSVAPSVTMFFTV